MKDKGSRVLLEMARVLAAALAAAAAVAAVGAERSSWAYYPRQRCAGQPLRLMGCDDGDGACAAASACRRSRAPEDCRSACLAAGDRCGGYDTEGRLYAAAACSGDFGRVGGGGDLFVRQSQPPAASGAPSSPKISHMVVLYMENRPFDHILGCMVGEGELPGADGINGSLKLWTDASHTRSVNVTCGTAPYVCKGGPSFDNYQGFFPPGSNDSHYFPYGPPGTQSLDNAYANGARPADDGSNSTAINSFSGDQLPVKRAIVRNFGTFNRMFSATPTASTPNHMFTQSATSCGLDQDYVSYVNCGGIQPLFPQPTIYDNLVKHNKTIGIYTHWKPNEPGGAVGLPDAYMSGVLRHVDRVFNFGKESESYRANSIVRIVHIGDLYLRLRALSISLCVSVFASNMACVRACVCGWACGVGVGVDELHRDARNGNLPAFSFVIPPGNRSDHPCNDIRNGEGMLKEVYESLRAAPTWESTLLIVTYALRRICTPSESFNLPLCLE